MPKYHWLLCGVCQEPLKFCDDSACSEGHDHSLDDMYCEECEAVDIAAESEYVLKQLLAWANQMGGWEAPAWERARKLIARINKEPYTPPTIEEEDPNAN